MLSIVYLQVNDAEGHGILEELVRLRAFPGCHHLIGGDFQGSVHDWPQLATLALNGWGVHGAMLAEGPIPTNAPPRGERRRLDELMWSPNMHHTVVGAEQTWLEGFSTHACLSVELSAKVQDEWGLKAEDPLPGTRLDRLIAQADQAVWDTPLAS